VCHVEMRSRPRAQELRHGDTFLMAYEVCLSRRINQAFPEAVTTRESNFNLLDELGCDGELVARKLRSSVGSAHGKVRTRCAMAIPQ